MASTPEEVFASLTLSSEAAKKAFVEKRFVDALRLYDEGLEKSLDASSLSALEAKAKLLVETAAVVVGGDDAENDDVVRAATLAAFILRLKPFYFEAATTYVKAVAKRGGVKAARILLLSYLAKDGTDEDAKRLLDSLVVAREEEEKEEEAAAAVNSTTDSMISSVPTSHLPDLFPGTADLATLVGNILNNSALCELKLGRYFAATASAAQALLFLTTPDARAKAVFRHAQALVRCCGGCSGGSVAAEKAIRRAEEQQLLKKAEAKVLLSGLAEAKGKHDWTVVLKQCLKDDKKVVDCAEFLNDKVTMGNAPNKGLGLVAKEPLQKGEILCVQQAVHFVPPTTATESEDHLAFPKVLLVKVLENPGNEVALRILAQKGRQMTNPRQIPPISEAFRRLPTLLPFLRDQMALTQIKEDVKRRGGEEMPLKVYEGTADYDTESRRLATLITDVVKKLTRQTTSLALPFDVRYKKTMTQAGGELELNQLGLWTIPSLLHHGEYPNATFGTMGGVAIVTAIRDVEKGTPLTVMMGGIQCLPERLRHLSSIGVSFPSGFDPDFPLSPQEELVVSRASETFQAANSIKMETVSLDRSEAKPCFEKAIELCLARINEDGETLERSDPLGLAAIYFTMADCLGGKKELAGMVKAYYMGIVTAHKAIVVNLDTLTRMKKMEQFIPVAKKLEEVQDQAELVAKNNPSLREEFQKIAKLKNIGPSIGTIREFLEQNLAEGCRLIFSTSEAFKLLC